MSTPSNTTQRLIEMLIERDAQGQRKYGHTLDRGDLLAEDWAQHAIEESLDRAGYLARVAETAAKLRAENIRLVEENLRLRSMILPLVQLAKTLEIEPQAEAVVVEAPVLNILTNDKMLCPVPSVSEPMPEAPEAPPAVVATPAPKPTKPTKPALLAKPAPSSKPFIPLPDGCVGAVEAAERMGVARNTFSAWVSRGLIAWAGEYTTPSFQPGKYVTLEDMAALPAKLEQAEKERREAAADRVRAIPTEVRSSQVKAAIAAKRDQHRPEGGISYDEAAAFLGISPDSVRLYAKRGVLQRVGETPYVTRASVVARKQMLQASREQPAFDNNEEGKLTQIDQGKSTYRNMKVFYLARRTEDSRYLWESQATRACNSEWEVVEEWRCNGLGRWESTPVIPGMVGTGNGTKQGAGGYKVPVLG